MGFDDRPADRQPHSHSFRLGCEEWIEDTVDLRWIEPRTCIRDRNYNISQLVGLGANPQHARPARNRAHGLDTVPDQIEDDLLQLHAVAHYGSQMGK